MTTITVSNHVRSALPVALREALGVVAGDRVEIVRISPGRVELVAVTWPVTDLKGMFGKPRRTVSIRQMNAAIASRGGSIR